MYRTSRIGRRLVIAALAVTTVGLSLVTGLSTAGEAGAASKATTIRVLVPSSGLKAGFEAVVNNFKKANPDVNVTLETVPSGTTYGQVLLTQLQAGSAADVFYTNGGSGAPESLLPLAKAGRLSDLSKEPWAKRVPDFAHDNYWVGKKLYGLPLQVTPLGLVYNTSKFSSMGLTAPKTFSGLLAMCRKVKDAGMVPISIPGQFPRLVGEILAANYVYSKTPNWNSLKAAGKTSFAGTPGWTTVIQRFGDMNNAGCFQSGVQSISVPQSFALIGSEQALMYAGPATGMGGIRGVNPNIQLAMLPFPGATAATTRTIAGNFDALAVNAQSKELATAKKFATFFAREGQSRLFAKVAGGISLHDANVGTFPTQFSALAPLFKAKKTVPRPEDTWSNAKVITALDSALIGSLTGQLSIPDGLKGLDTAWVVS